MAPSHDPSSHDHHDEPQEDSLRTPEWLPWLGFGLLMAGALAVYLFISPGVMSGGSQNNADAAVDGESAAAPAAPSPN